MRLITICAPARVLNPVHFCNEDPILKTQSAPLEASVLRKQVLIPVPVNKKTLSDPIPVFHPWRQWVHR